MLLVKFQLKQIKLILHSSKMMIPPSPLLTVNITRTKSLKKIKIWLSRKLVFMSALKVVSSTEEIPKSVP